MSRVVLRRLIGLCGPGTDISRCAPFSLSYESAAGQDWALLQAETEQPTGHVGSEYTRVNKISDCFFE